MYLFLRLRRSNSDLPNARLTLYLYTTATVYHGKKKTLPNLFIAQKKSKICYMLHNQFFCRYIQIKVENIASGAFKSRLLNMSHVPYLKFSGESKMNPSVVVENN